jgi:hypothetical protein
MRPDFTGKAGRICRLRQALPHEKVVLINKNWKKIKELTTDIEKASHLHAG